MKKHTWKIIFAVIVLLLGASVVFSQHIAKKANEGIVLESHIKGNPDALVTLTEYSDFQCPACRQFYPFVKEIMEEHGDKIRFEYKHFPLISIHPYAVSAARAAEAAGQQGKFYEMHDKIFENQSAWSNSATPNVYFDRYAEELGLDMKLYKRHMSASVIDDAVKASFKEAQRLGLRSTPTFFLNDSLMTFDSFEDFVAQIEAAAGVVAETASSTDEETDTPAADAGIKFGI